MKRGEEREVVGTCAYCGGPATDREHVIARQFYTAEDNAKHKIPRIFACRACNQKKQKAEDLAGVLIPLMDDGQRSVDLDGRIERTLNANGHIAKVLRNATVPVLSANFLDINDPSKVEVKQFNGISLTAPDVINVLTDFFGFVVKGLYAYEFKEPFPNNLDVATIVLSGKDEYNDLIGFTNAEFGPIKMVMRPDLKYVISKKDNPLCMLIHFRKWYVFAAVADYSLTPRLTEILTEWREKPVSGTIQRGFPELRVPAPPFRPPKKRED